jgi:hypothetical protein
MAPFVNDGHQFAAPILMSGLAGLQASYTVSDGVHTVSGTTAIGPDGLVTPVVDLSSLSDGPITASATQTGPTGLVSTPGTTTSIKKTVPPAGPVVTMAAYVGIAGYQAYTVTFSGQAGTILYYSLTDGNGVLFENQTIAAGGVNSATLNLASLNDGTLTMTATLTDNAGNTSAVTTVTTTKITGVPVGPSVSLNSLDDSGASNADYITNVRSPRFTVTGSGTPTVYVNGSVYTGQVLADGLYTVTATLTDAAGNVSPVTTAPRQLKIDTSAPAGGFTLAGTVINGQLATKSPTLALALSFADSDSGMYQVAISTNGGATYGAASAYATSASATLGADGLYTVAIKVTDIAGNVATGSVTIRLDMTPPVITATMPATTTGTFYDVGAKITMTYGATDVDNATTAVKLDSTTVITGGVIDIDTLTAGTHTIVITATDGLGNTTTRTITFTIHATIKGLINAVNDGAARGLITATEKSNLLWYLQKALGTGTPKNFIGQFNWEVNYQGGKAISSAEAALLLSWGNDLYARTP